MMNNLLEGLILAYPIRFLKRNFSFQNRDVVTTLFYRIMHNGVTLDMKYYNFWMMPAINYIRPRLSNTARFNRAYNMPNTGRMYYVLEYLYRLRFNTQIAIADFTDLEDALETSLKISWTGNVNDYL